MHAQELREVDTDDLHRLYDENPHSFPEPEDLEGELQGTLLAGRGFTATKLWRSLSRYAPWSGVDVEGRRGINVFGFGEATIERHPFERYVEQDRDGGALVFDYDVSDGPYAFRRIKEHVREIEENLYLVKVIANVAGRQLFLFYYALEPIEVEIPVE